jgi:hypothetical protein
MIQKKKKRYTVRLGVDDDDDEFIPPGAKHLKGTALFTSQGIYTAGLNITRLHAHCSSTLAALQTVCNVSSLHVLVLGGRRALLKLCFQVFIVLSPADEARTCRMYEGVGRCGVEG